jgi:hypothetical protein
MPLCALIKPMKRIEMNQTLSKQTTYPYVIRRVMSAVYQRIEVVFGAEKFQASRKAIHIVTAHYPYDDDGKPTTEARSALIDSLKEITRSSRFRMCAVFAENDSVYVEPDGQLNLSMEAPSGGVSL